MRVVMIDVANQTPHYVYPLCRALSAVGCAVELITAPFIYDELPPAEIPMHEWFARLSVLPPMRRLRWLRQVARGIEYPFDWGVTLRHIRMMQPEVVHVQWAMVPPVDALAFRAIKRAGARLVYTVHDIHPRYGPWRRTLLSTRPLYALPDDLVVHTEASRDALCAAASLPWSRVHVMPHGNLDDWVGPPVPQDLARASLALPGDAPVLLFFGGIKLYKRLDLLIEAMPRVLAHHPRTRLLIAGQPANSFAPYQEAIDRLGLGDHVIRRLAYVPENEVARYFCAADVVVLPYVDADFSGVLLAAYTFGRPVVSTDTGGLREMVERDGTGYVVPQNDILALSRAIIGMLSDPERATQMGERARKLALTKYTWSTSAQSLLRVYDRRAE